MNPVKFKHSNITFAENQPEYLPLPAYKWHDGTVISCWSLNLFERLRVLFFGRLYLTQLTFNSQLQPQRPHVSFEWDKQVCSKCGKLIIEHTRENSYYCPEIVKDLNSK